MPYINRRLKAVWSHEYVKGESLESYRLVLKFLLTLKTMSGGRKKR